MISDYADFCYTPFNLAVVINNRQMRISEANDFLTWVFDHERERIHVAYRYDRRKLFIETQRYSDYLQNKRDTKAERPAIAKDYEDAGISTSVNEFFFAESDPHQFLKGLRLRILYFNKDHQARTTLRQVLKHYGYRRRSYLIIEEIEGCLAALGLTIATNSGETDLLKVKLDDRLVFEIERNKNRIQNQR